MKRLALLTLLAGLGLPATAQARRHRHHARSRAALVSGCELPGEPSWSEWRADMAAEGFTAAETEALEACDP